MYSVLYSQFMINNPGLRCVLSFYKMSGFSTDIDLCSPGFFSSLTLSVGQFAGQVSNVGM